MGRPAFASSVPLGIATCTHTSVSCAQIPKMHVVVSGATGRTGRLVHNLLSDSNVPVKALVRSEEKGRSILGENADLLEGDITDRDSMNAALEGAESLVVLTSAVPQMKDPGPPLVFDFAEGGMPEAVDWHGAKNQIDAAKQAGVKHIVMVGSMGSTDENNMLNKLGNGNILIWKRRAEQYLIDSGIDYTVINPAGLVDKEPNEKEIIFGDADRIFDEYDRGECSIARADVARVVVAALDYPNARNKVFDVASHARPGFQPTKELTALFDSATPGL